MRRHRSTGGARNSRCASLCREMPRSTLVDGRNYLVRTVIRDARNTPASNTRSAGLPCIFTMVSKPETFIIDRCCYIKYLCPSEFPARLFLLRNHYVTGLSSTPDAVLEDRIGDADLRAAQKILAMPSRYGIGLKRQLLGRSDVSEVRQEAQEGGIDAARRRRSRSDLDARQFQCLAPRRHRATARGPRSRPDRPRSRPVIPAPAAQDLDNFEP